MKNLTQKLHQNLLYSVLLLTAFMTGGCSQTDLVSIGDIEEKPGNEITLNITAPDALSTRADANHKLRFTAKLFKDKYNSSNGNQFLEMKQGIATDGACTITFSVPQGDYSVLLFADYIPSSTECDSKGFYEDAYYDTSSDNEDIRMIAFTTNSSDHSLIQKHCINNENYDCFSAYTGVINKTEAKYEKDIVLQRVTSKIRFVSTTPAPADVKEIIFSKFYCFDIYKQFYETVFNEKSYGSMKLSSHVITGMSDPEKQEVFYFYSLGAKNQEYLGDIAFTIYYTDGSSRYVEIPEGKIKIRKNYITTVRSSFLDDEKEEVGDIILHLSSDDNWSGTEDVFITE